MTENKFSYLGRKEKVVVLELGKSFRKCCVRFFTLFEESCSVKGLRDDLL